MENIEIALAWWNGLNNTDKIKLFLNYARNHFTEANGPYKLTTQEIYFIYNNQTPNT